jgi:hypothetical protein
MPKPTTKSPTPNDVLKESAALAKTFLAALKEYKDSPAIRKAVRGRGGRIARGRPGTGRRAGKNPPRPGQRPPWNPP